jgi:hypothetical protein
MFSFIPRGNSMSPGRLSAGHSPIHAIVVVPSVVPCIATLKWVRLGRGEAAPCVLPLPQDPYRSREAEVGSRIKKPANRTIIHRTHAQLRRICGRSATLSCPQTHKRTGLESFVPGRSCSMRWFPALDERSGRPPQLLRLSHLALRQSRKI